MANKKKKRTALSQDQATRLFQYALALGVKRGMQQANAQPAAAPPTDPVLAFLRNR